MARKSRKDVVVKKDLVSPIAAVPTVYKAAGYIRLSVEDNRKKGDSIETQKAILQNFFSLSPEICVHDFYIDNGASGMNFERAAFERMLSDAESGTVNCIVVKDLSRLGRNAIDTGYYIEKYLPSLGVRFIAVNDDYDSIKVVDGSTSVMLPLKNVINEAYALDISRKVAAQQHEAMKSGLFVGARPPYGYLKADDDCHKLVVDPVTAPIVRQIFEWARDGAALNDIVRRLNEAGVTTPSRYRVSQGIIKHENLVGKEAWQTFTLRRILMDEVYVGDMVQGKSKSVSHKQVKTDESGWIRIRDTHEPIISRELFAAVQAFRERVSEQSAAQSKSPYTPNIFKGKIFCGHCGGPLHRQRATRVKSDDIYRFHCLSNSRKARGSCVPYSLPEEELKEMLLCLIEQHVGVITGKALKLRGLGGALERERTRLTKELETLRRAADKDSRMTGSLFESLAKGLITAEEYRELRLDYETKAKANLVERDAAESRLRELEKQTDEYCALSDLAAGAKNDGVTARLIAELVERIRV